MHGVDWYRQNYEAVNCPPGNYICPDTLACAESPLNCPCAFHEDECKLGDGSKICVSKREDGKACDIVQNYRKVQFFVKVLL